MTPLDLLQPQTNQESTSLKLKALRSLMLSHQLDSYLILSTDEHLNEYLPEAKKATGLDQWLYWFCRRLAGRS